MNQAQETLDKIAHLRGLGKPLLFAADTESKPGFMICHFVRMETIEFPDGATSDDTLFVNLHPNNDPRVEALIEYMLGNE